MARSRNTNRFGDAWSSAEIDAVWAKCTPIDGYSPDEWRRDICGHAIQRSAHRNSNSGFGWKIDHIKPASKGVSDDLSNLQPLYWETNRDKADLEPRRCP